MTSFITSLVLRKNGSTTLKNARKKFIVSFIPLDGQESLTLPSYRKARVVVINQTAYIHVPKDWFDYQKRSGRIKPKIEGDREVYFLDMIIDKDITISAPKSVDISLSK